MSINKDTLYLIQCPGRKYFQQCLVSILLGLALTVFLSISTFGLSMAEAFTVNEPLFDGKLARIKIIPLDSSNIGFYDRDNKHYKQWGYDRAYNHLITAYETGFNRLLRTIFKEANLFNNNKTNLIRVNVTIEKLNTKDNFASSRCETTLRYDFQTWSKEDIFSVTVTSHGDSAASARNGVRLDKMFKNTFDRNLKKLGFNLKGEIDGNAAALVDQESDSAFFDKLIMGGLGATALLFTTTAEVVVGSVEEFGKDLSSPGVMEALNQSAIDMERASAKMAEDNSRRQQQYLLAQQQQAALKEQQQQEELSRQKKYKLAKKQQGEASMKAEQDRLDRDRKEKDRQAAAQQKKEDRQQRLAKEKQEREQKKEQERQDKIEQERAYLALVQNSLRLGAKKCDGKTHVITGSLPSFRGKPTGILNVDFKVSAPGGHPYEYGTLTNVVGMNTGCVGDTELIGMPGFDPKTLNVKVIKAYFQ